MGISPFVRMDTALLALAGYHALSIYTFVRTTISNEFHVALLGSGPTEIRLMIITMNLLILIFGAPQFGWMGIEMAWCDIAVSLMTLIFFVIFTGLVFSYADELRHKEGSKAAVDAEIARDASASLKMTLEAGRGRGESELRPERPVSRNAPRNARECRCRSARRSGTAAATSRAPSRYWRSGAAASPCRQGGARRSVLGRSAAAGLEPWRWSRLRQPRRAGGSRIAAAN